jgi:transposase
MSRVAVGWDLHRKFSYVSVQSLDEQGELRVIERQRLQHDNLDALRAWLARLPAGTPVAMEGAFGWPWVADLLLEVGLDPHLGHPPALRVLAKHEAKCDRRDADRFGRFWLQGTFPESYLATPAVRQVRERVRYRMALVGLRGGVKNRIQALLHRQGLLHSFSDLFGQGGRSWLNKLTLPAASREVLDGLLRLLDMLQELIDQVEDWMSQNLTLDDAVARLQTIPGIGLILAHVIRAEAGDLPARFPSAKHFASYAGLAPVADDTAERRGRRHISQACNHALRWALIEAAGNVVRMKHPPLRLQKLYQRLSQGGRQNKSQAKVAVARELAELVYVIWKKGEPYRESAPARPGTPGRVSRRRRAGRSSLPVRSE